MSKVCQIVFWYESFFLRSVPDVDCCRLIFSVFFFLSFSVVDRFCLRFARHRDSIFNHARLSFHLLSLSLSFALALSQSASRCDPSVFQSWLYVCIACDVLEFENDATRTFCSIEFLFCSAADVLVGVCMCEKYTNVTRIGVRYHRLLLSFFLQFVIYFFSFHFVSIFSLLLLLLPCFVAATRHRHIVVHRLVQ